MAEAIGPISTDPRPLTARPEAMLAAVVTGARSISRRTSAWARSGPIHAAWAARPQRVPAAPGEQRTRRMHSELIMEVRSATGIECLDAAAAGAGAKTMHRGREPRSLAWHPRCGRRHLVAVKLVLL